MADMDLHCDECHSEFFIVSKESELSEKISSIKCRECGKTISPNQVLDFNDSSAF